MLQQILTLKDLKGIGSTVSNKLINYYGNEKIALNEISNGNIYSLVNSGLSEKKAINLVKSYNNIILGNETEESLQTPDIIVIYEKIIKIIQSNANTLYSKSKILVDLIPFTFRQKENVSINNKVFEKGVSLHKENKNHIELINKCFSGFTTLKDDYSNLDISPRKILTTIPETLKIFQKLKITNYCSVELVHDLTILQELNDGEELILLLTEHEIQEIEDQNYIILPNNVLESPWTNIIPEKIFSFYINNLSTLKKTVKICNILKLPDDYKLSFPTLKNINLIKDLHIIDEILSKLNGDGTFNNSLDPELNRLMNIIENSEDYINYLQNELNVSISTSIEKMQIQVEGRLVLELLQHRSMDENSSINELLESSLSDLMIKKTLNFEQIFINKFNLKIDESELIGDIFNNTFQFPVELNDDIYNNFSKYIQRKYNKIKFFHIQKMAQTLEKFKPNLILLVKELLDIDYYLTLGKFGCKFNLKLPNFVVSNGFSFLNANNIFLTDELHSINNLDSLTPISYYIGNIEAENASNLVLLSGANSGGKTTLLQLIAQIVLLGHMGLGVPAEACKMSYFDQIYFYQKPTGSADAGAFETALKNFSTMTENESISKLILADEMEAISEPDASSRVISAFLDTLNVQRSSCGVFVSHLSDQIANNCDFNIRIDGIEATGLDSNNQLQVQRNPKINYHARSTPQLIVESLIKKSKGKENEFYNKILEKFKFKEN